MILIHAGLGPGDNRRTAHDNWRIVIDLHSHILPGLDDGPLTWEEALQMARMAVADGIGTMVATPHLFKNKVVDQQAVNFKKIILENIEQFKEKLAAEDIALNILPGCDIPLCAEALQLLQDDLVLTINDSKRYLLLELPGTSLPPAVEEICFSFKAKGVTPIITHPERHLIIHEMPQKLARLLDLGCLAQVTALSLLGGFGRGIARFARKLVKQGYIQVLATDAHDAQSRPPMLRAAVSELAGLVGKDRAWAMVTTIPERIIHGEPCF